MQLLIFLTLFNLLNLAKSRPFTVPWRSTSGYMIGLIRLGDPSQNLQAEFNFSSTNFYVVDRNCQAFTPQCLSKRQGFDTSSNTFEGSTTLFTEYYHSQLQNGLQVLEATEDTDTRIAAKLPIGIVVSPSRRLEKASVDAVMGLGLYLAPNSFTQQYLDQAGSQFVNIHLSSFTYSNRIETSGGITFGSVDTLNCQLNFYYQHIDSTNNEWMVRVGQVHLGEDRVRGGRALIAPGMRYIFGPEEAIKILHQRLGAKGNEVPKEYTVDCAKVQTFPQLTIFIHGYSHVFTPYEYVVRTNDGSACILLIRKHKKRFNAADWILGAPILRNNCLLMDFQNRRIAFSSPIQSNIFG